MFLRSNDTMFCSFLKYSELFSGGMELVCKVENVVSYFFDEQESRLYYIRNDSRQQQHLSCTSFLKPVLAIEEIYKVSGALCISKGKSKLIE